MLDRYNPRSVAFQVATLNDHIAALPSLKEYGLIERPQRLAVALQAIAGDGEAATLDVKTPVRAGAGSAQSRRRHRAALAFPHGPNASRPEEADGPRVIYDIRHVTTYAYESPVSFRRAARCS